jgi:Zn-dependent protease
VFHASPSLAATAVTGRIYFRNCSLGFAVKKINDKGQKKHVFHLGLKASPDFCHGHFTQKSYHQRMNFDVLEISTKIAVYFIPFLFALCFHEYAHGWVARLRGDNTAQMMGRLSMNPLVHMDFIGTFLLPLLAILFPTSIFFGWAKPVPVNARNLKNPRIDMFWIALAGPASNLLLAIVAAAAIWASQHFLAGFGWTRQLGSILAIFIQINLFLAVFNAIPLHPLDGGKIIARFLPHEINNKLEQHEQLTSMILLALIMFGALRFLVIPVQMMYATLLHFALG